MTNTSIEIIQASANDIKEIVKLSFDIFEIDRYFTMKLGKEFILDFYSMIREENKEHFFVAKDNEKVIGFIIGCSDPKTVTQILKRNIIKIGWRMMNRKYKTNMRFLELLKTGYKNYKYIQEKNMLLLFTIKNFF